MTDYNAIMHQITALLHSPPGGFHGPTSNGREGKEMEGERTGGREGGGVGEEREGDVRFFL